MDEVQAVRLPLREDGVEAAGGILRDVVLPQARESAQPMSVAGLLRLPATFGSPPV